MQSNRERREALRLGTSPGTRRVRPFAFFRVYGSPLKSQTRAWSRYTWAYITLVALWRTDHGEARVEKGHQFWGHWGISKPKTTEEQVVRSGEK